MASGTDISNIPKLGTMHAQRLPGWGDMTGDYQMDPAMQGIIDNMWSQFNERLPGVYGGVNASLGQAGRTGSGIHNRLLGDAGNRAFLGMTGQVGQMRSGDYQGFMGRKSDMMNAAMQEDAALRSTVGGIRQARIGANAQIKSAGISARPGLINAYMNAGNMMDYAMNPYAQGMGYMGQYNQIASPYQTNTGYTQSPYLGAMQGAYGMGSMGYGIQGGGY